MWGEPKRHKQILMSISVMGSVLIWSGEHPSTRTKINTAYTFTATVTCTPPLTHAHRANSVCLFRVYLTRCHETAALCSWLLISSINSPPPLSIHPSPPLSSPSLRYPLPPPCPRWPPWLRGYLLLWQPLAGETSRAVSERAPCHGSSGEGRSITENKEDFFCFTFLPRQMRVERRGEGNHPSATFWSTVLFLGGAHHITTNFCTMGKVNSHGSKYSVQNAASSAV